MTQSSQGQIVQRRIATRFVGAFHEGLDDIMAGE